MLGVWDGTARKSLTAMATELDYSVVTVLVVRVG